MKKYLLMFCLLFCVVCNSQVIVNYVGLQTTSFANTGSGATLNEVLWGATYHVITWNAQGTVSTCQVRVDSSADGISWNTGDIIAAQTCTSNSSATSVQITANFVRVTVSTLSGGGTVTVTYTAYQNSPTGVGNCTVSVDRNSLTCPGALNSASLNVTGNACFPGVTSDGTPVLNQFAVPSGTNLVKAVVGDSNRTDQTIIIGDNTICPATLTGNNKASAHAGDMVPVKADAIGLTAGHIFGVSSVTAATAVDLGVNTKANLQALSVPYCGTVEQTTAANGTGNVKFDGCRYSQNSAAVSGFSMGNSLVANEVGGSVSRFTVPWGTGNFGLASRGNAQMAGVSCTSSQTLTLTVTTNNSQPSDGTLTITLEKNTTSTGLNRVIAASAVAGAYQSTATGITLASTDLLDYLAVNTSPATVSATVNSIVLTCQ